MSKKAGDFKNAAINIRIPHQVTSSVEQIATRQFDGNKSEVVRQALIDFVKSPERASQLLAEVAETSAQQAATKGAKFNADNLVALDDTGYAGTIRGPLETDFRSYIESSSLLACFVADYARWFQNHGHGRALRKRFKIGLPTYLHIPCVTPNKDYDIRPVFDEIFKGLSYDELVEGRAHNAFHMSLWRRRDLGHGNFVLATDNFCILSEGIYSAPWAQVYLKSSPDADIDILSTYLVLIAQTVKIPNPDKFIYLDRYISSKKPRRRFLGVSI